MGVEVIKSKFSYHGTSRFGESKVLIWKLMQESWVTIPSNQCDIVINICQRQRQSQTEPFSSPLEIISTCADLNNFHRISTEKLYYVNYDEI